jgi:hypothetical protein
VTKSENELTTLDDEVRVRYFPEDVARVKHRNQLLRFCQVVIVDFKVLHLFDRFLVCFLVRTSWLRDIGSGSNGKRLDARTSYTLTRSTEVTTAGSESVDMSSWIRFSAASCMTWTGSSDHPATSTYPMQEEEPGRFSNKKSLNSRARPTQRFL